MHGGYEFETPFDGNLPRRPHEHYSTHVVRKTGGRKVVLALDVDGITQHGIQKHTRIRVIATDKTGTVRRVFSGRSSQDGARCMVEIDNDFEWLSLHEIERVDRGAHFLDAIEAESIAEAETICGAVTTADTDSITHETTNNSCLRTEG